MIKTKTRNCSIDIFRYICAVMVIAIHTNPFLDASKKLGYIFSQIVPRIGVPFFFAVAGYFYIQKLERGETPFFSYFKRLLITYFIWSCLYDIIDFVQWGHLNPKNFITSCVIQFIITGSHYHFWFFPALIFSVCCTTLIIKIVFKKILIPLSIILYTIGCLGCSYYEIGITIPILGKLFTFSHFNLIRRVLLMGFPFFICGYLVYKIKEKVIHVTTNKKLLLTWFAVVAIWLLEIYIVRILEWQTNIIITFALYPLVIITLLILLKNPLPQYKLLSAKSRVLANFTYYSHPFCIMCLGFLANNILHINLTETPIFILTTVLTCLGGFIIYKWNNKLVNYIAN